MCALLGYSVPQAVHPPWNKSHTLSAVGPGGAAGAGDSQAVADARADGTGRSPTQEASFGLTQALPGMGLRGSGDTAPSCEAGTVPPCPAGYC